MIKKVKILITIIIFISLILLATNTKAAMEIKSGTSPWVNVTISNAFAQCYNLRVNNTTLGNNTVDPHLSLHEDWGAVTYLATSMYGSNGVKSSIETTTTGNESGVKDLGKNASYVPDINLSSSNATRYQGWNDMVITYRNTKYVDKYNGGMGNMKGWATGEVNYFLKSSGNNGWGNVTESGNQRIGPFGVVNTSQGGNVGGVNYSWFGQAKAGVTFRPAIWN